MWSELISKIHVMYGAGLLGSIAGYAMYVELDGGIVEMCITGIGMLLMAKVVKGGSE